MKKSYASLKAEIARLEQQAESARQAEVAGVVARIREAIEAYGLTPQDLGFGGPRGGRRDAAASSGRPARGRASVGAPKYRDPETGRTWTGRGKPPAWIVGAKDRDAFLIDPSAASGEGGGASSGSARKSARGAGQRGAGAAKRGAARGRRRPAAAEKTPAVEIESGAATE